MYVYEMLGAELLSTLYDRLGRQLMDPQLSAVWQVTPPSPSTHRSNELTRNKTRRRRLSPRPQDTEVLLFGFQSIAETIDVNYSDVIPGLVGLMPRINVSNVMLADTVMYTIGTRPPELLKGLRRYFSFGL